MKTLPLGIASIGKAIASGRLDNSSRLSELDTNLAFLDEKIGTRRIPTLAPNESTLSLAEKACRNLLNHRPEITPSLDVLAVCTQNPDTRIPHLSALLHRTLGLLPSCSCFDISLGCTGFVHTLAILVGFMQNQGLQNGLLITCDPYSKVINPSDRNTVLLFGDAATASLITTAANGALYYPHSFCFTTLSQNADAISCKENILSMNGRAVFDFAITSVPRDVQRTLAIAGLQKSDISKFLFHQGSKFIVEQLARAIGLPREAVPISLSEIGNTVSSSIPLLLAEELSQNHTRPRHILISGFGVGLSVATGILTLFDQFTS